MLNISSDIPVDDRSQVDAEDNYWCPNPNHEIIIDMQKLLKIAVDNKCVGGKLVLKFNDDYYDGLSYHGLYLRV